MVKQNVGNMSRSVYPRNAKSKSGYMTDPSKDATSREQLKNGAKFNKLRKVSSKTDIAATIADLPRETLPTVAIPASNESRFTLPNSPTNVNLAAEVTKRQVEKHNQLMRDLKGLGGATVQAPELEVLFDSSCSALSAINLERSIVRAERGKSSQEPRSSETKFTIPNSPRNANIAAETVKKRAALHQDVIRNLKGRNGTAVAAADAEMLFDSRCSALRTR